MAASRASAAPSIATPLSRAIAASAGLLSPKPNRPQPASSKSATPFTPRS
jgi:hypothetical protein